MYSVYKVINLINGKFYIGVHQTLNPNDSYYGSGKLIKQAIKKYGKENFVKEILYLTENKLEAYEKEKQFTVDFKNRNSYNLKLGGTGGFTKENAKKGYEAVLNKYGNDWHRMANIMKRSLSTVVSADSS